MRKQFTIQVYTSLNDIKEEWDALLPPNHNLISKELCVPTKAQVENLSAYYIVAKQQNKIVACLYAQLLRFKPKYIQNESNTYKYLGRFFLECIPLKLIVFGNLFRHDGTYIYLSETIKNPSQALVHIIDDALAQIKHTAYFLKDLPEQFHLPFSTNPKYHRFNNDLSMAMSIKPEWQSLEDYITCLKKKYKQRAVKTRSLFTKIEMRVLTEADVVKEKKVIYELYLAVTKNQAVTLGLLNEDYFPIFKQQMGDRLHMMGYYLDGKMLAFGSAIVDRGVFDMNYIGFDYSLNQEYLLYFNLLFSFLEQAIKLNCHTLELGRTVLEAKAILGAQPRQVYSFYKINNALVNRLTAFAVRRLALEQGEDWQIRQPFKGAGE